MKQHAANAPGVRDQARHAAAQAQQATNTGNRGPGSTPRPLPQRVPRTGDPMGAFGGRSRRRIGRPSTQSTLLTSR